MGVEWKLNFQDVIDLFNARMPFEIKAILYDNFYMQSKERSINAIK